MFWSINFRVAINVLCTSRCNQTKIIHHICFEYGPNGICTLFHIKCPQLDCFSVNTNTTCSYIVSNNLIKQNLQRVKQCLHVMVTCKYFKFCRKVCFNCFSFSKHFLQNFGVPVKKNTDPIDRGFFLTYNIPLSHVNTIWKDDYFKVRGLNRQISFCNISTPLSKGKSFLTNNKY